ncbi:Na+/H+ antiporter NhaC family protein [Clostridium sp. MCC353]|uniref:YfcC family protein n=1 Tax=Clostridium sp. MCC353 TaxID=2592646 RepID=UPI00207A5BC7|nr:Na+/H+ antiporter NhaC family protein [Clostridium sp. MCC353]
MKKKKIKLPNTMVLILMIALFAVLLTWIIPAGEYVRVENAKGIKVVDPNQFILKDRTPVSPFKIPFFIIQGYKNTFSLFLCILFGGGAFHFVSSSGALESLVAKAVKRLKDKTWIFIPIITILFTLLCTSKSLNSFIAFAPILVVIARSLGFDSIVGVSFLILGGAVGFSTGTLQQSTTMVAQGLAELPLFSGLGYRMVCLVVFSVITNIYILRYAMRIKKDPQKSYMYDLDQASGNQYDVSTLESFGPMTARKWSVLAILVATLTVLVAGAMKLKWGMDEFSIGFIWCGLAMGLAQGMGPSKTVEEFFKGAKGLLFVGSLVCVASSISLILSAGGIIDTIVHALAVVMLKVPAILRGPAMFLVNILVNVLISSGSGQAAVVIPIMVPVADMIGMTRQTAVLAYNFGDGFSNYVLPTVGSLMGILGMANVPYDRWMKFMWKLFLIWVAAGCVMMMIAQMIHLGPM